MKALAGHLSTHKDLKLEGQIRYNGEEPGSGRFLTSKVVDYCDEVDLHAAVLTVRETLEFAWRTTTGGHHMQEDGNEVDPVKRAERAAYTQIMDANLSKVANVIKLLGLEGCQDTIVGDDMLKGISGGQKRRVTVSEKMPVKCLDLFQVFLYLLHVLTIVVAWRDDGLSQECEVARLHLEWP